MQPCRAQGATYVAGHFAQAVKLNSTYTVTPANPAFDNLTAWTDSVWVNLSTAGEPGSGVLMACRDSDSYSGFVQWYDGTGFGASIPNASGNGWVVEGYQCMDTLSLNTWHMVTYTVSGTGYNVYIDGVLGPSGSGTWNATMLSPSNCNLYVGGRPYEGAMNNGSMDDFQLFTGVLSASEINSIYLTGATAHAVLPTTTPVQIASGATFDLAGNTQQVASLSDSTPGKAARSSIAIPRFSPRSPSAPPARPPSAA